MSVVNAIPLIAAGDDGYSLTRSLRFRFSASASLTRTPATASNRKTFTWSGWVKRGTLSTYQNVFGATTGGYPFLLRFDNDNTLFVYQDGVADYGGNTSAVYRDPAAWYHIVLAIDTTQATDTNRLKLYINGVQVSVNPTYGYFALNVDTSINSTGVHSIGGPSANYFDGYMAEVNFVDGQALAPSSFGAYSIYNQWLPKKYAGTYGTNGFYLPFTNNASAATLGNDFSGNSNTWTTNNISVTAGSTYDSMTDVPTLTSATAANYCVGNPLASDASGPLADGNLSWRVDNTRGIVGGIAFNVAGTSNFYMEATVTAIASTLEVGIVGANRNFNGNNIDPASYANGYGYISNGNKKNNNSATAYGATFTTGDVIGIYAGNGSLTFYKNNTSQGSAFTGLTGDMVVFAFGSLGGGNTSAALNFGQQPFVYTPPSGYLALNTFNL